MATIPNPNPITNTALILFDYMVGPNNRSNGLQTNQAITDLNVALVNQAKSVDKSYAQVGDQLSYTILLSNTGNATANQVLFVDTIPVGTSYVANSLFINLAPIAGDPTLGVTIPIIEPNSVTTVTFNVLVNSIPAINPVQNQSITSFNYVVDPSLPPANSGSISNLANTSINQAVIDNATGGLTKSVDKSYAQIGDVLTYTIVLKNTGNTTADSIVLIDTIPTSESFITNSLTLNGVTQVGDNPNPPSGFSVGSIGAGVTATVEFKVTVNTIPNPNPIPNAANVGFYFTIDPSVPDGAIGSGNTNIINTQVNQAIIDNTNGGGMVKSVNKDYANVGDVLTYTIVLKNTGSITANNVVFTDTLPSGTSFVNNSVVLDGVAQPGLSPVPGQGVNVGTIGVGQVHTVIFMVNVITIPTPNPIVNNGTVNFNYVVDPVQPPVLGGGNSNGSNTQINNANFNGTNGMNKSVSPTFSAVGDVLTYTILLNNQGNVTANNVIFIDTIPSGTTFIANSVTLNGIVQPGASPAPLSGLNVGNIGVGQGATISFKVTVVSLPTPNTIPNQGVVKFNFVVDPTTGVRIPASNSSNQTSSTVNQATIDNTNGGGFTKTVDKAYANLGDVITFTMGLKNTGNVTANNVVFIDTIPNGTTLVPNSVMVNGVPQIGGNPNPPTGVPVGIIAPGATSTVVFQVLVNTIPVPDPIINTGSLTYQFTVDPSVPNGRTGSGNSNPSTTQVNNANFSSANGGFTKTASASNAKFGDTIVYTLVLTNLGNTTANNVIFTDTIPQGTTFVPGSVVVNGTPQPIGNPTPGQGVSLGNIAAGASNTVTFSVIVVSIPNPNPTVNVGILNYNYFVDPFGAPVNGSNLSTPAPITINQAIIDTATGGMTKSVDKSYAQVGDVLTYTIVLKNTGNVTANNIILVDTIPSSETFMINSLTLNGAIQPGGNPNPPFGFNVGSISAGATATVEFKVTVNTIPIPNTIQNSANVNFSFTANPLIPDGASGSGNSNIIPTTVNQAIIDNGYGGGMIKSVDNDYANVGDVLTYTIVLKNTGSISANNVVFTDTLPSGTSFVNNSVLLDGVVQPGISPVPGQGVNVGTIGVGQVHTITFKVNVLTIPTPNPIVNNGTVNFNYVVDPAQPPVLGGGNSNGSNTQINNANFNGTNGMNKSVSPTFSAVGDVLTYTIALKNQGNTTANNVLFTDTIPQGTTFISGSVFVNGTNQPASNPAPGSGINVGSIAPTQAVTISFKVTVITLPTPNTIQNQGVVNFNFVADPTTGVTIPAANSSNQISSTVNQATIDNTNGGGFTKSVDKAYANLGDIITFTMGLKNTGNVTANNVVLIDTIPNGTSLIPNSVLVNGVAQLGSTPNPPTGVTVGSIGAGATSTVVFKVIVNTIPVPDPISNTGSLTYQFTVDPSVPNSRTGSGNSNTTSTKINNANFNAAQFGMVKTSSKLIADLGDTIVYNVMLNNLGNVPANNVIFTDTMPSGTTFVGGSVLVNGVSMPGANPTPGQGVSLGSILPGVVNTVTFSVVVSSIPNPNPISNLAILKYTYTVDPSNPNGVSDADESNSSNTQVNYALISQANGGLIKSQDKNIEEVGETVTYTISMKNNGNTTATNVTMYDTIPNGSQFVSGSVVVNGVPTPGGNPQTGVNIGALAVGATATLSFVVQVVSLPSPNVMTNSADVDYGYLVDQTLGITGHARNTTNQVNSTVVLGKLTVNKTTPTIYADLGDTITYNISILNSGNVTANNIIVQDTIPNNTSYVNNSFTLNGVVQPGANIANGYNIGSLAPGATDLVSFKVLIFTLPSGSPISNTINTTFGYVVDPLKPIRTGDASSTSNGTTINNANFNPSNGGFVKSADKTVVTIGDTITYTLSLKNLGNVTAQNVVVVDTVPEGTTFVEGSLLVNGVPIGGDINTGVGVGNIPAGGTLIVNFKVLVTSPSSDFNIHNAATVNFGYLVNPTASLKKGSNESNSLVIPEKIASLELIKVSDNSTVYIGSKIVYTILVENTGNVTANNVFIIDTLPSALSLVPGSLVVDGVPYATGNITTGVTIPNVPPMSSVTVSFTAEAVSVPIGGVVTNYATANFSYTVDPLLPDVPGSSTSNGDQIVISNYFDKNRPLPRTTNCPINDGANNYLINNISLESAGAIAPINRCNKKTYTVEGLCTPEDYACVNTLITQYKMWKEQTLTNSCTLTNGINEIESISASVNIVRSEKIAIPTTGSCTNLEGKLLSGYNQIIEGLIKYNISFTNDKNEICNKEFYSLFSSYIAVNPQYASCELEVRGCIEDIVITRLCSNSLSVGAALLLYLVPKDDNCTEICNCNFNTDVINGVSNSKNCPNLATFIGDCDSYWNEFNEYRTQSTGITDIGALSAISAVVNNVSYKLSPTPKLVQESNEGLELTGNMLLVSFVISAKIAYISNDGSNSMKRVYVNVPASSYIIVDETNLCASKYSINVCIEDIYACNIDGENIFTNSTILIKAKQCGGNSCCRPLD